MSLNLSIREEHGITIVQANGRIVFGEESNAVRREIKPLVQVPGAIVVVDMAQVAYMDSGGLGALVGLYTTARAAGGQLLLAGANSKVMHVLEITKLADILGKYASVDDAVAGLRRSATA